ncbi:RDD family protein [Marinactinospora thermotolerans]|uniref:RDD family protein n=1 Tax=Marinactinospora thermotolerans TaxID=531310 RepID=UPI003D908ADF
MSLPPDPRRQWPASPWLPPSTGVPPASPAHPPFPSGPWPTGPVPATPGARLAAWLIDTLVCSGLLFLAYFAVMLTGLGLTLGLGVIPDNQVTLNLFLGGAGLTGLAAVFLYHWLPTARHGRTLGKLACGIRVVAATGRPPGKGAAALRAVLLGLLGLPCGLGHLVNGIALLRDEPTHRGLHDRACGTRVVRN